MVVNTWIIFEEMATPPSTICGQRDSKVPSVGVGFKCIWSLEQDLSILEQSHFSRVKHFPEPALSRKQTSLGLTTADNLHVGNMEFRGTGDSHDSFDNVSRVLDRSVIIKIDFQHFAAH